MIRSHLWLLRALICLAPSLARSHHPISTLEFLVIEKKYLALHVQWLFSLTCYNERLISLTFFFFWNLIIIIRLVYKYKIWTTKYCHLIFLLVLLSNTKNKITWINVCECVIHLKELEEWRLISFIIYMNQDESEFFFNFIF